MYNVVQTEFIHLLIKKMKIRSNNDAGMLAH